MEKRDIEKSLSIFRFIATELDVTDQKLMDLLRHSTIVLVENVRAKQREGRPQ